MHAVVAVTAAALACVARAASAQGALPRLILEPEAACRTTPDATARVVRTYPVGQVIDVDDTSRAVRATWYSTGTTTQSGRHPPCWVDGAMTAPIDRNAPESALLALTERALRADCPFTFEQLVVVENMLIGEYGARLRASGLLQYRRLSIVALAARRVGPAAVEPLAHAWLLAHRDLLEQSPFAAAWLPIAKPYWDLYDRYKNEPWADDLAWTAAQIRPDTDECYSDCVLSVAIIEGPMQYWIRLPHGQYIVKALAAATSAAKYADDLACYDRKEHPGARSDSPVPSDLVKEIRDSLTPVQPDAKAPLLAYLAEAEAKCR